MRSAYARLGYTHDRPGAPPCQRFRTSSSACPRLASPPRRSSRHCGLAAQLSPLPSGWASSYRSHRPTSPHHRTLPDTRRRSGGRRHALTAPPPHNSDRTPPFTGASHSWSALPTTATVALGYTPPQRMCCAAVPDPNATPTGCPVANWRQPWHVASEAAERARAAPQHRPHNS